MEEEEEEEENPNFWDTMDEATEENTEKRKGKDSFVYVYIYICKFCFENILSLSFILSMERGKKKGKKQKT